jgi:phospholipase D1/2
VGRDSIAVEGVNCWRRVRANRVAFLIDGATYFDVFAQAVERARHSILVAGWDFNARILLRRDGSRRDTPDRLGDLLNTVVSRRPGLHAFVLDWDFAMIYAMDREVFPSYRLAWKTHRRFHFHLDDCHPVGAAHHQKIAVVDGAIAFVGGLDFGAARWDTPEHRPDDPRRVDPWGQAYQPFHDVQVAVDGDAAAAIDEYVRERWWRATGQRLRALPANETCWPEELVPDVENVDVAISRTEPEYDGRPEVCEIERMYVDAIRGARRFVYIENQYLTAARVGDVLASRLREEDGPEIVIVNPRKCAGWLEETTMGVLRARLLRRLREQDRHGRLRVYYPDVPGLGDAWVKVHAKLLVADDALLVSGSANLNNRSMGLDTECDLAIEGGSEERLERAIAGLRNRLLGEHLGVDPDRVAAALARRDSLIGAIDDLRGGPRTLTDLTEDVPEWLEAVVPEGTIVDPERPVDPDQLLDLLAPRDLGQPRPRLWLGGIAVLALLALAAAWRWTSLGEWLDPQMIAAWARPLRASSLAPFALVATYVVSSLLMVPVTLAILATALIFGPFLGAAYALVGSVASALAAYGLGSVLGRQKLNRLTGSSLNRLSRRLARRGILVVAMMRIVPVAPFTIVNLAAGASHIGLRDFLVGTVFGMTPGIILMTIFADRLAHAVREPHLGNVGALIGVGVLLLALGYLLHRRGDTRSRNQRATCAGQRRG